MASDERPRAWRVHWRSVNPTESLRAAGPMTSFTIMRERSPGGFETLHHGVGFADHWKALHYALSMNPPSPGVTHWLVIPDDSDYLERASFYTVEQGHPQITSGIYTEPRYRD
jgi:hypothetical protein